MGDVEIGRVPEAAGGTPQRLHASVGEADLDDAVDGHAGRRLVDLVHLPHLGVLPVQEGEHHPTMDVVRRQRIVGQPDERPRDRLREHEVVVDVAMAHPELHDLGIGRGRAGQVGRDRVGQHQRLAAECAEVDQDVGWHNVGSLRVAASDARWEELKRAATAAKSYGFDLELVALTNRANDPEPSAQLAWKKCEADGLIVSRLGVLDNDLGKVWHGGQPLARVPGVLVLLLVGVTGYALAFRVFCKRDLPAPL